MPARPTQKCRSPRAVLQPLGIKCWPIGRPSTIANAANRRRAISSLLMVRSLSVAFTSSSIATN